MSPSRATVPTPARLLLVALLPLLAAGCGRGGARAPAPPPSLEGVRVMIVPVPAAAPDAAELDVELAFWLAERSPHTDWIPAADLQAAVDRGAVWRVRLDGVPRGVAADGHGPRLLDPAWAELRRVGALVDSSIALIPLAVRRTPAPDPLLEMAVALAEVRGGQVYWLGTVTVAAGTVTEVRPAARLAEALARALIP